MLKKLLFSIGLICIAFLTGYATAQSYFTAQPADTAGATPQQNAGGASPNEFQSQTQQQQDKKSQALSQQLSQELAKIPPPPPPPTPHEAAGTSGGAGQTPGQADASHPGEKQDKPPTPTAGAEPQVVQPSGPIPATPPAQAPAQTQVYTGFQNPNENQTPAPGQNQSSPGGWNIQY